MTPPTTKGHCASWHFPLTRVQSFKRNDLGEVPCPSRVRPASKESPADTPQRGPANTVPRVNVAFRVGHVPVSSPFVRVTVAKFNPFVTIVSCFSHKVTGIGNGSRELNLVIHALANNHCGESFFEHFKQEIESFFNEKSRSRNTRKYCYTYIFFIVSKIVK